MAEILPIVLALCSMLLHTNYAKNYAGLINTGLLRTCVSAIWQVMCHLNTYVAIIMITLNIFATVLLDLANILQLSFHHLLT